MAVYNVPQQIYHNQQIPRMEATVEKVHLCITRIFGFHSSLQRSARFFHFCYCTHTNALG